MRYPVGGAGLVFRAIGFALAGPLSEAFGVRTTLLAAAALLTALASRSVHDLRRLEDSQLDVLAAAAKPTLQESWAAERPL